MISSIGTGTAAATAAATGIGTGTGTSASAGHSPLVSCLLRLAAATEPTFPGACDKLQGEAVTEFPFQPRYGENQSTLSILTDAGFSFLGHFLNAGQSCLRWRPPPSSKRTSAIPCRVRRCVLYSEAHAKAMPGFTLSCGSRRRPGR